MMRFVVLHEIIFSDNISFVTMSLRVKLRVKILKFLLSILALRQSPFNLLTTLDVGSKIQLGVKILLLVLVEMLMLQSPGLGVFVRLIFPDSANLENKLMKLMLIMTRGSLAVQQSASNIVLQYDPCSSGLVRSSSSSHESSQCSIRCQQLFTGQ